MLTNIGSDLLIFGRQPSRSRKKWIGSSRYMLHNQAMHRMPKALLRAGFVTGDGGRWAARQRLYRIGALSQIINCLCV